MAGVLHRYRWLVLGLGLCLLAFIWVAAGIHYARQSVIAARNEAAHNEVERSAAAQPTVGLAWLTRFDALVAEGHRDAACLSALALLRSGPNGPRLAPELRVALLERLSRSLSLVDPALRETIAAALGKTPLSPDAASQVLAGLAAISDAQTRTRLARRALADAVPSAERATLLDDPEPRIRAAAAAALRQAAAAGDQVAVAALHARQATEPDPRVRAALADAQAADPTFGEDRRRAVPLPPASQRAREQTLQMAWDLDPQHPDLATRCQSQIRIDADGRAFVDTTRIEGEERWHVTYPAWAWKDAAGNLIIDARGQPVNHLTKPDQGDWSPDSMQISPDGKTTTIDDRWQREQGGSVFPGSG